jgi:hypothetical protein
MSLEEITQYMGEQSIRGNLAREFAGIISDYQSGAITAQDKEQLVNEILSAYHANGLAEDEVMMRWAVSAASIAASVV